MILSTKIVNLTEKMTTKTSANQSTTVLAAMKWPKELMISWARVRKLLPPVQTSGRDVVVKPIKRRVKTNYAGYDISFLFGSNTEWMPMWVVCFSVSRLVAFLSLVIYVIGNYRKCGNCKRFRGLLIQANFSMGAHTLKDGVLILILKAFLHFLKTCNFFQSFHCICLSGFSGHSTTPNVWFSILMSFNWFSLTKMEVISWNKLNPEKLMLVRFSFKLIRLHTECLDCVFPFGILSDVLVSLR